MYTYLQEKNATANVLGRTDGATANTIRDNAINDVRQNEIANAYPFSWLRKTTSITIISGIGDLPEDFNIAHTPKIVKDHSSQQIFSQVNVEAFDRASYGYFIDWNTSTNRWQLNCTQDGIFDIVYYCVPPTLTTDSTVDIIPDLKLIAYFAASTYWLSSERDETNSDRFAAKAEKRLKTLINIDKRSNPTRLTRSMTNTADMGWNIPD